MNKEDAKEVALVLGCVAAVYTPFIILSKYAKYRDEKRMRKMREEADAMWGRYHEGLQKITDDLDKQLETARFWEIVTRED